jgi:hypothetical protein
MGGKSNRWYRFYKSKLINTETTGSGCCLDNRMRQDVGWEKGKKHGKRVNLRG